MGTRIQKPKVLGIRDIFKFWLRNLQREKPYLLIENPSYVGTSENRCTKVWYTVKHELEYLKNRVIYLEAEVLKLKEIDDAKSRYTSLTVKISEHRQEIYTCKEKIKTLSKASPEDKKLLMTYALFNQITQLFNKKAVEAVIQGETLNLGNRLGFVKIRKIYRFKEAIDWGASRNYKQELINTGQEPRTKDNPEGLNWFIYRNDSHYLRWSWIKSFRQSGIPMLKNGKVYAFYPANSSSGNKVLGPKGLLAKANFGNPFLHLRYDTLIPK